MSLEDAASRASWEVLAACKKECEEENVRTTLFFALMKTRYFSESFAGQLSALVDLGMFLEEEQGLMPSQETECKIREEHLRKEVLSKAEEAFIKILGQKEGMQKAQEFVSALLGNSKEPSSLFFEMKRVVEKQTLSLGSFSPLAEAFILQKIIHDLSEKSNASLDKFILNQALMENGRQLLATIHNLLLQNADLGNFSTQAPV